MLKRDLLNKLSNIPDDFDIKIIGRKKISDETLMTMSYSYPFEFVEYEFDVGDIGWSEKYLSFDVDIDKPLN